MIRPLLTLGCAATLLAAGAAHAAAVSCHCFRDREYDVANPSASDAYLLATASNTFLAAVSGIPKREIVQARMSGTTGEDLWIAAHVARRRGVDPRAVLQGRAGTAPWREFLRMGGGDIETLGPRFIAALASGAPDAELAWIAAAEELAERIGTPWDQLDALAYAGAGYQETIVAALIGLWAGKDPLAVLEKARAGTAWSSQLAALGKVPKAMETEVPTSFRPGRMGKDPPGAGLAR